jgi:hypothetical protein
MANGVHSYLFSVGSTVTTVTDSDAIISELPSADDSTCVIVADSVIVITPLLSSLLVATTTSVTVVAPAATGAGVVVATVTVVGAVAVAPFLAAALVRHASYFDAAERNFFIIPAQIQTHNIQW